MRRGLLAAIAAFCLVAVAVVATPAGADSIEDARRRANAAVAERARAESALDGAERELASLERRAATAKERVDALRKGVRSLVIRQYVTGGPNQLAVLTQLGDPNQIARAQTLSRVAAAGAVDGIDEFLAAAKIAREAAAEVSTAIESQRAAVARFRAAEAELKAELSRLEEAQRARLAAAARSAPAPAPASSSAPATQAPVLSGGSWICPVAGPVAFSNDWGQPRSGGRRHQGNDMFAPHGTPVVAPVSGFATLRGSSLGGLSFFLTGDDGNSYFGTHMSAYGTGGRVSAGTVLGYVGSTGNARGSSPHLHFEIHPGGGYAVNPYPTISRHC